MVKLPKMMLRVLGWLLRALLPELNAMPRFLRKRLPKEAPQTPRSTRPIDGPRGLLLKLDHYRRAHHMKGFNEKFMTKCEARRRGSYRRACAFETRASPIHCVANGRLRQAGNGADDCRQRYVGRRIAPDDLALVEEPVERIRQTCCQLLDRRGGIDGEPGARTDRVADLLTLRARQEERLEAAEILRTVYMARLPAWISSRTLRTPRSPSGGGRSRRCGG